MVMYRSVCSREMFCLMTELTSSSTRDGMYPVVRSTVVKMLVWVIIMIRPEATPWPETSPMASQVSPAEVCRTS